MPNKKYKVVIYEKQVERDFAKLKDKFSNDVWVRMLDFLTNIPHLGKKEMQFRKYNLPDAYRVLYLVLQQETCVRVVCVGDHRTYERFLKKHGKRR